MQHEMAAIPMPPGGRITTVYWHLTPAEFDALMASERLCFETLYTDDGVPFRAASLTRSGVFVRAIESRSTPDQPRVAAEAEVRAA